MNIVKLHLKINKSHTVKNIRNYSIGIIKDIPKKDLLRYQKWDFTNFELSTYLKAKH